MRLTLLSVVQASILNFRMEDENIPINSICEQVMCYLPNQEACMLTHTKLCFNFNK